MNRVWERSSNLKDMAMQTVLFYGNSMYPTLRHPDILYIKPCDKLRPGDIIVFRQAGREEFVTHRVISVNSLGILTKGDNCDFPDSIILKPDNIIGCVAYIKRGKRVLPVHGGIVGQYVVFAVRVLRFIDRGVSSLLRPLYYGLSRTGVLRRLIPRNLKPRVLCIQRSGKRELQMLMGRHIIGRRLPCQSKWQIRRPFKVFIDESSLSLDIPEEEQL